MQDGIILKKGKQVIFDNKHLWIFSGAIASYPKGFVNGHVYPVYDLLFHKLGSAYFNQKQSLAGRIIAFGNQDPLEALYFHLDQAISLRDLLIDSSRSTGLRLVNGEADFLPGLIIDQYGDSLVLQSGTLGMDLLKPQILSFLISKKRWNKVFEKSSSLSRKEEGLKESVGVLFGPAEKLLEMKEENILFSVDWEKGQKTGFFLDQREMRKLIGELSKNKKVLNCFSYTGGFSLYALKGGAKHVDSVDISLEAISGLQRNLKLNQLEHSSHQEYAQDVFAFLEQKELDYEVVILDPPAFAKKKKDIPKACKGYREINAKTLSKMPARSLLLTCSCSYYMKEELFQMVLFQAAKEAGRSVRIVSKHRYALDHPVNLFHPESEYLKSFLLYVE